MSFAASSKQRLRLAAATTVAATLTWAACSRDADRALPADAGGDATATGGRAATAGVGVAGAAASGGASGGQSAGGSSSGGGGATVDAGQPYPGAKKCKWPGWYRSPRFADDCFDECIPDDAATRVPEWSWEDRPSWCAGCRVAEPTWIPNTPWRHAFGAYIMGYGEGPDLLRVGFQRVEDSSISAILDGDLRGLIAWRRANEGRTKCGYLDNFTISRSGHVQATFTGPWGSDHDTLIVPRAEMRSLMTSTETTVRWPAADVGLFGPNNIWLSTGTALADFAADAWFARWASSGPLVRARDLPGAPPLGQFTPIALIGEDVLINRWQDTRQSDIWRVEGGNLVHLLGAPDRGIVGVASDGAHVAWVEATERTGPNGMDWAKWTLYASPYSPGGPLTPKTLWSSSAQLNLPQAANGKVSGWYLESAEPYHTAAIVADMVTGEVRRASLPEEYNWTGTPYTGAAALVGAAATLRHTGAGHILVSYPYASMELL